jgi:hypothetical protein
MLATLIEVIYQECELWHQARLIDWSSLNGL